jgi:hypothetical protein
MRYLIPLFAIALFASPSFAQPKEVPTKPQHLTVFIDLRVLLLLECLNELKLLEEDIDFLRNRAKRLPQRAAHYEALLEKLLLRKQELQSEFRLNLDGLMKSVELQIKVTLWKFGLR